MKLVKVLFFVVTFAFLASACGVLVDDSHIVRAVENQGYSNVQINSKHILFVDWYGCSNEDEACYDIQATNPLGKRVGIIACAGWPFKGVTVRSK